MGRHALVLGTATYRADPVLNALPGVRHDVEQMTTVLNTDGEFDSVDKHLDLTRTEMVRVIEG